MKADTILAFFGYNESFEGPAGLENFKGELDAFITHTLAQKYNGGSAPRLVLVSPIAFEDLSAKRDLPDGKKENENLALYTKAMAEIAAARLCPGTNAPADVTDTGLVDPVTRSHTYTSVSPLVSDATRADRVSNATKCPSSEMDGSSAARSACVPSDFTDTRTVVPVTVLRTNTSDVPLVSPLTRLVASEAKATWRPFADTRGW